MKIKRRLVRVEQWLGMRGPRSSRSWWRWSKTPAAAGDARHGLPRARAAGRGGDADAHGSDRQRDKAGAREGDRIAGTDQAAGQGDHREARSLLDEPDQDARRAALLGLSHIGPPAKSAAPGLVDKLTGLLNNLQEDDTLRTAAHSALKKIDPRTKLKN